MSGIRISSRYAKALLELNTTVEQQDAAFKDMSLVHNAIDGSRDLQLFLQNPVVKKDKKVQVLEQLFAQQIGKTTMAFITLLTTKGRESLLGEMAASFVHQFKAMRNITEAKVITAVPIDAATRAQILEQAKRIANGNVELLEEINPDIVGGFVLNVADKQMDASVAEKIVKLRREFSENPYVPEY